ncbi:MAG: efflux transporter outer membrane subunit [Phycisphaerales bacterium]
MSSKNRSRIPAFALLMAAGGVLTLAGCAVGPDYVPPKTETPADYSTQLGGGEKQGPAELKQWWKNLGDPALDQLLQQSISQNLDLRAAAARIAQARAFRGVVNAGFFPTVDASASYERSRASANSNAGFGTPGLTSNNFLGGFDVGWEVDVFGRVARGVESADADVGVAVENQRFVLVSLMAEVARNYVDYRAFQRRLAFAKQNADSQRDSLRLVEVRFNAGIVSELDVARAKALLATTESAIPSLDESRIAAANRLAVLLGQSPGTLEQVLAGDGTLAANATTVPVGLPSDLLRRRPDIRSAERSIASANAQIGVATADLFPRFSLTGSFGLASGTAGNFFEGSSRFWSFGPAVKWNVFDAGRINANIAVQEARTYEALVRYQQSVLTALEEVENSLVGYQREQTRRDSLATAVEANQRAVNLATELNTRGLTDYLSVLDAQRALFLTQDQLAESEGAVLTNLVALYKALGGGWEELPVPVTPQRKIDEAPSWWPRGDQAEKTPPEASTKPVG